MMRHWREREFATRLSPAAYRSGLKLWAMLASRPALFLALTGTAGRVLAWMAGGRGRFRSLPLASGWTLVRDLPAPEGRTFQALWAERQRKVARR